MHGEEVGSCGVDAGYDEVGTDVAFVFEEVLLQERHAGDDTGFTAGTEGVELQLGGDQTGGELCVGSCTGTGAPDVRTDVMQLFAVLVCHDGAGGGTGIGCDLK